LYCGTEYGLYISYDDGASWKPFQLNLPVVPITDMAMKENDLVIATQGRSFWILDDLAMIQQSNPDITKKNLFVYDITPAWRYDGYTDKHAVNAGFNPPNGVCINYFLKNVSDSSGITITLKDKNKKAIRTFSNKQGPDKPDPDINEGMNQFVWNMYYPDVEKVENMVMWTGISRGPKAAPGIYSVSIKYGNDSVEKPFTILANPTYKCTQEDYDAQFDFLFKVSGRFNDIQKAIKKIRILRQQMDDFTARQGKDCPPEIKDLCDSINKSITSIEEKLYQTKLKSSQDILNFPMQLNNKIANLYDYAESGINAPTQQVKDAFGELSVEADTYLKRLDKIIAEDVVNLNKLIIAKSLPVIVIKGE
jgi:hypothetical protein